MDQEEEGGWGELAESEWVRLFFKKISREKVQEIISEKKWEFDEGEGNICLDLNLKFEEYAVARCNSQGASREELGVSEGKRSSGV